LWWGSRAGGKERGAWMWRRESVQNDLPRERAALPPVLYKLEKSLSDQLKVKKRQCLHWACFFIPKPLFFYYLFEVFQKAPVFM